MFVLLLSDKISYSMYILVRKKALIYEKRENFVISTCFNLLKNIDLNIHDQIEFDTLTLKQFMSKITEGKPTIHYHLF